MTERLVKMSRDTGMNKTPKKRQHLSLNKCIAIEFQKKDLKNVPERTNTHFSGNEMQPQNQRLDQVTSVGKQK